mmetsp:Transcript_955/g.1362  ORF Transcript_955/g.1362 Transcript_955/m.1362 type:complete len:281 (-) Transcript_955:210-1052(-)|eukprot:CAMPEP_0196136534 /NCGR_PEP_ID=MMETSP0910-20130528/4812_1 /TAXON_ID=49265 /ORGANISM="Thalassiosira rotula, Strain GSO102" /LENGTH=280 /DNA_ID=CAMNT_0041396843 /DNA_START=26 /DNA_END=868 /DNA_ORIENTATION=-
MVSITKVLVTGGNTGIGFAVSKQLALQHNCHVFLTARTPAKGHAAVESIRKLGGSVEFVELDTSADDSVIAAAETVKSKLNNDNGNDSRLYGIVNNAGIGLNTGGSGDILNTNLHGPKRVCDAFLDILDREKGRIVNLGSGSGPMYVGGCRNVAEKKILCDPLSEACTWEWIEEHAKNNLRGGNDAYGLSKALVACYTGILAREHPTIRSSCVSPGFINTQMTEGWGASKSPEEGTVSIMKCLFGELEGNGWYYGSDGVRSPYHYMRDPGTAAYDGVNPF